MAGDAPTALAVGQRLFVRAQGTLIISYRRGERNVTFLRLRARHALLRLQCLGR